MKNRKIDHLVYCVPDLDEAIEFINIQLGIRPIFGGYHKTKGTKNALLNLGTGCYLEILSIDETNTEISAPRWMGVDLITEPKLTRWALKSDNILQDSQILKKYSSEMGSIFEGSRLTTEGETLTWSMTLPLAHPEVELLPFMVDWSRSAFHPSDKLEQGSNLKEITFSGSTFDINNQVFDELGISYNISNTIQTKITATIEGPKGLLTLK